jgi:carboxypeptidase Q
MRATTSSSGRLKLTHPHAFMLRMLRAALLVFVAVLVTVNVLHAAPVPRGSADTTATARYRSAAERLIGAALSSDRAYEHLSQLCDGIGNRLSGSTSLERAVVWAEKAMRDDGLERVRLQPVSVPHWVRGRESAEMVVPGPQRLSMLGLGRSVGTPPGGITADVVAVESFSELNALPEDQVRGKIVLYDVPFTKYGETVNYRGQGAKRAASRGAVAALVRSVGPVSLRTPHTGNMSAYVDSFPRIPAAAVSIEDAMMMHRLLDRGQHVRVKLEMEADTVLDAPSNNVIGELRGRERPDEVVVVGGHLDSWDVGQGAHDDGGGCVISLEAVRLLKALNLRPRRTVRCVFFTNEENGARGAARYDSLSTPKERHVAAIESDGGVERPVGFGVTVYRVGADKSHSARTAFAASRLEAIAPLLAGLGASRIDTTGGGTDIGPLMKRGIPGIAHETVMEHYFDWHHTAADMLDKVDPVELRKNVAAMAVMIYALAEMPGTLLDGAPGEDTSGSKPVAKEP